MLVVILLTSLLVCTCADQVASPNDVIGKGSIEIAGAMEACAQQLYPGLSLEEDMLLFWHPEYELQNEQLGCLLMCALYKLTLIQRDENLNEENLQTFLVAKGAGMDIVEKVVNIVRDCYHPNPESKACSIGFELLICLRKVFNKREWLPPIIANDTTTPRIQEY